MYILCNRWYQAVIFLCLICAPFLFSKICLAEMPWKCVEGIPGVNCNGSSGGGGSRPAAPRYQAPAGPTQEQLKQQREAKDLRDSALDKNDEAYDAYQRGDYAKAVQLFKEALDDDSDNQEAQHNLSKAQEALNYSALHQINTVAYHSQSAVGGSAEAASAHAQAGIDTPGLNKGAVEIPTVNAGSGVYKDPVVPPSKQTPVITALESKRGAIKQANLRIEEQRKTLDFQKDAVQIAQLKQRISENEHQIHMLNFSITEELRKAPAPNSKPEKKKIP